MNIKHKAYTVSVLLYHFVCPTKYKRMVVSKAVDEALKEICREISMRYEIEFLEIGADRNHVHFLIQSVPTMSPTKIIKKVKSIIAREIFKSIPRSRKSYGEEVFVPVVFFVNTARASGSEAVIRAYVKNQGIEEDYEQLFQQE